MRKAIAWGAVWCVLGAAAMGAGSAIAQGQGKVLQNAVLGTGSRLAVPADCGWTQEAEAGWLPATVPGDVHLDLLANKKIPDPFFRDNESKLQWIENESWEYRLSFDARRRCWPARTWT